jgi:hypothetical protein
MAAAAAVTPPLRHTAVNTCSWRRLRRIAREVLISIKPIIDIETIRFTDQ